MEKKVAFRDLQAPPSLFDLNQLARLDQLKLDQLFPLGLEDESIDETWVNISATTFLYHKFREFFIDNIPVELVKQLPTCWRFTLGLCCYGFALLVFIYFCLSNYQSAVNSEYIALDSNNGICQTVPIPVTGTYYADANGNWEGTADFKYYQAPYAFFYNNFIADDFTTYQAMMKVFYGSLSHYGQMAKSNNLAMNLVLWMTYVRFYSTEFPLLTDFTKVGRGNLQYIQLTGDPSVVFNTRYSGLALGTPQGICEIPSMVSYDEANGEFQATMNREVFLNLSACAAVTQPFIFEQNINLNPYFSIEFDVRSFAIALGVNLRYNDIRNLMPASDLLPKVRFRNTTYRVGTYFDIRYPDMSSIFCVYNETALPPNSPLITQYCLISAGSSFFLPVFNHMGDNLKIPKYCDCNTPIGKSQQCNYFFLMAGLIAFDPITNSSFSSPDSLRISLQRALMLLVKHKADYSRLNRAAFNASASSVFYALNTADPSIKTAEYVESAYDFCKLDDNVICSLITFYTLDQDSDVTKFHYPLSNGSCRDTITPKDASWVKLAGNSPTPLTQIYYKCHSTSIDALINAVGVASGNTSIAMLLLLFISVPLVFGFMACCRVIPKEQEFREKEKSIVLDTLATVLLRIRDKHYEALDPCGTAANLAEELIIATNFSYYEAKEEEKKIDTPGSSKNLSPIRQVSKQKSFRNFKQQRDLLGKEYLYRALAESSSRLNSPEKTSSRLNSPQKSLRLQGGNYSKVGSPKDAVALNELEKGESGKAFSYNDENDTYFDDLTLSHDPTEDEKFFYVKVINDPEDKGALEYIGDDPSWLVPYHENQFTPIIHGMCYHFSVSMQNQVLEEEKAKREVPLYQRDLDYSRGNILAHRLTEMDGQQLIDENDPGLFVALVNALGMHASLTLGVEMKTIAREYADRVGYQIGDKIFTYSTLVAFSLLNPVMATASEECSI
mmetsp:Transcript_12931/g.13968  ORF Transcript_12931/g.13968 Transcript_12931/m.13968 type:complete len:954 (+) Transcript_12931:39-2900(+)